MRVYICGKIGGLKVSEEVKARFDRAEKEVKRMCQDPVEGVQVVNPASYGWQQYLVAERMIWQPKNEYAFVLARDIKALADCDALYLLDGWEDSPGARVEKAFAEAAGISVWREGELPF